MDYYTALLVLFISVSRALYKLYYRIVIVQCYIVVIGIRKMWHTVTVPKRNSVRYLSQKCEFSRRM